MKNILVVAIEEPVRKLVEAVFRNHGFAIHHADHVAQTLAKVDLCLPDLVIVDLHLSRPRDGLVIASRLARDPKTAQCKIVLMCPDPSELSDNELACVHQVISKPFEPLTLRNVIESLLQ